MLYIILFLIVSQEDMLCFATFPFPCIKTDTKRARCHTAGSLQKSDDTSSRSEQSVKGTSHHNQLFFR